MKKWMLLVVVAVMMAGGAGCSWMRSLEQWKCDRLGWCCFGTRPSQPAAYPAGAMAYPGPVSAPMAAAPMVAAPTGATGVMAVPAMPAPCGPAISTY